MIADINKINLRSKFFAELVKTYYPITELKDGVVYIKTNNNSDWNKAVSEAKESFANCSMRGSWIMKYDIDVLSEGLYADDSSIITALMGDECNMIMPVFLPDRQEQHYFVGTVTDMGHIEPAASFLSADAQDLMEACLPYALSDMDERSLKSMLQGISDDSITDIWVDEGKQLKADLASQMSFRGMVAPNPLAMLGDIATKAADAVKNGLVSYKKRREMIMNLASIGKKLRSEDPMIQQQGNVEFAQAYQALSQHELALLVRDLVKDAKTKSLKNTLAAIADRETLGANTKYSVVFRPWNDRFKEFGHNYFCQNCIFIAEGEALHPLKMSKSSLVIYTLALIEKVTKNKKHAIVNIKANSKAFTEVYKFLFNDYNKEKTEKLYKELFKRNEGKPNMPLQSGRLSENYKDIEAGLQRTFMNLDEDYSPFMTNATTPLSIIAEKIMLPPELTAIKIH